MVTELCVSTLAWNLTPDLSTNNGAVGWANRYWSDLTNRGLDRVVHDAFRTDTIPHGTRNTSSLCDNLIEELNDVKLAAQLAAQEPVPEPVTDNLTRDRECVPTRRCHPTSVEDFVNPLGLDELFPILTE